MSVLEPFRVSGAGLDLSPRFRRSSTVVGSPAAAAETIVASVTIPGGIGVSSGVLIIGYAAVTVGTNGTALTWKIRRDNASGTTLISSGAKTATAANLVDELIAVTDTSPSTTGQVYVLTLTVTAGSAASTVSAVELAALVI